MKNSAKYRVPPLKRTQDGFIDDKNSQENPRIDLGASRHTEVRRDKDEVRSIGVTLYDVDYAIKTFIEQTIQPKIEDNNQIIDVPILYANGEKWTSIQKNGYLKDKKGMTMAPLIAVRRSGVTITQELKRNKVATINQLAYVTERKYSRTQPYDRMSLLSGAHKSREYFVTPIPDYVDVTYDFIVWCDHMAHLNHLIEQFIYFTGQSFGDKNFFKFATNMESVSLEDTNSTGIDRVVRATFQINVHAYLLPKEIAATITTKRLVSPSKIHFVSEAFVDINTGVAQSYRPLNYDPIQSAEDFDASVNDFTAIGINKSPDVYTPD